MSERRPSLLPGVLLGLTVAAEAGAVALSWGLEPAYDTVLYAVFSVTMVAAGMLIVRLHPRHPVGWVLIVFGLLNAVTGDLAEGWGLAAEAHDLDGGAAAEWVSMTSWLSSGLGLILTFLLFPTGRLPGRSWRWAVWAALLGFGLALPGWGLSPERGREFADGTNPWTAQWLPLAPMLAVGMILYLGAFLASALSLVVRLRRSRDVERQQLKWFVLAAAMAGVTMPLVFLFWGQSPLVGVVAAIALTAIPVAACVAILRYHLYDVDVVINRAVVYGTLTLLLAAAYGATTIVLGTTLGRGSAWATAGATLVVAAAFAPLRSRIQDTVDARFNRARHNARLRMAGFLESLRAGRAAPEEVVTVLRDVVSDPTLSVSFFLPASEQYVDTAGAPAPEGERPGRDTVLLQREGRSLARVTLAAAGHDRREVVRAAAEAGALAIEIAALQVELRRQLAEVQASRARILQAGHLERRRLERNLHDGAQQRLVSVGLALRHVQHQLRSGSTEAVLSTLDAVVGEVSSTIQELRELAHGLPPAALDGGLEPAFRELAARTSVPVEVRALTERLDEGLEAAAYFIGCEGLTNAVKHAGASRIVLSAERRNGDLVVSVADDGAGGVEPSHGSGLNGLADRVAALGGSLSIDSRPGAGTVLTAELPCAS